MYELAAAFAARIHLCHLGQRQGASFCRQTMMTASKQQHHTVVWHCGTEEKEHCITDRSNFLIAGDCDLFMERNINKSRWMLCKNEVDQWRSIRCFCPFCVSAPCSGFLSSSFSSVVSIVHQSPPDKTSRNPDNALTRAACRGESAHPEFLTGIKNKLSCPY